MSFAGAGAWSEAPLRSRCLRGCATMRAATAAASRLSAARSRACARASSSSSSSSTATSTSGTAVRVDVSERKRRRGGGYRVQSFDPSGDQRECIDTLVERLDSVSSNILRGVTGSGKTLVMAHTIARTGAPALVLCHNKTLAAQVARELREYLPSACVELFISYYRYYRPESYKPATNKYFNKVSSVDPELNAMRHRATKALFERTDTVIVASVSCIYGLGVSSRYLHASFDIEKGQAWASLDALCSRLREIGYSKAGAPPAGVDRVIFEDGRWRRVSEYNENSSGFQRSHFRVEVGGDGDYRLFVWPPYEESILVIAFDAFDDSGDATRVRTISKVAMRLKHGDDEQCGGDEASAYASDVSRALMHVVPVDVDDDIAAVTVYPATHHTTSADELELGCQLVEEEMEMEVEKFEAAGKLEEAERLRSRCLADIEMLREEGLCPGLENYSIHFDPTRSTGEAPETLIDYLSTGSATGSWTCFIDESHVTVPQLRAMFEADRSRKKTLIEHGFRLPSALDNRPLRPEEFFGKLHRCVFVSATPGDAELEMTARACKALGPPAVFHGQQLLEPGVNVVEMIVRPTFVVEPPVSILPSKSQLDVLLERIESEKARERGKTIVLTILKKDAEDLATWLNDQTDSGVRAAFIHSGVDTTGRSDILKSLQEDEIDVIVGVNLLREGIDLPQVSLVAVLNADSEGFLRSDRALIQMAGRAARNANGKVIFFADRKTDAMRNAIREMDRRRRIQMRFNELHGKVPVSARQRQMKSIFDLVREDEGVSDLSSLLLTGGSSTNSSSSGRSISPRRSNGRRTDAKLTIEVASGTESSSMTLTEEDMPHLAALRDQVSSFPTTPGVYVWSEGPNLNEDTVLYVGKSNQLRTRAMSYLTASSMASHRIRRMLSHARCVSYYQTDSDSGALLMESEMIRRMQPRFNIKMRDDSSYPYICIDFSQKLPTVQRTYSLPAHNEAKAFGPFTDQRELSGLLDKIETAFCLRKRAIGAKFNSESIASYLSTLRDCVSVLEGDGARILREAAGETGANQKRLRALADLVSACGAGTGAPGSADVATVVTEGEPGGAGDSPTCTCSVAVASHNVDDGAPGRTFVYTAEIPWERDGASVRICQDEVDEVFFRILERHYVRLRGCSPSSLVTLPRLDSERRVQLESLLDARLLPGGASSAAPSPRVASLDERPVQQDGEEIAVSAVVDAASAALDAAVADKRRAERALGDLEESLALGAVPTLIEAYDVSHFQGKETVASRVCFQDGKPAKHLYRRYNIRSLRPGQIDDYAAIREVMRRRMSADADAKPSLILIDGGKGQLKAAEEGIAAAALGGATAGCLPRVIALAKREEEVFLTVGGEAALVKDVKPLAHNLLRHMRDEAHRFALSSSRRRRSRKLFQSTQASSV